MTASPPRLLSSAAARTLLAAVALGAQPTPGAPQAAFEPAFKTYGSAQGMYSTLVEALHQDDRGFLWIGTHDGLLRFDGRSFRTYRTRLDDTTSLADDFVTALAQAEGGRIWVGAQRGGLQLFDPLTEAVRRYPLSELGDWRFDVSAGPAEGRSGRLVSDILPFATGTLLLLTDVGLVRFDPVSGDAANLIPSWEGDRPRPRVTALCATPDGRALAALSDRTLALVDETGRVALAAVTLPDSLAALEPVADGYVAASFDAVVLHLSPDGSATRVLFRPPPVEGARTVRDILALPDGRVWVATTRGAYLGDRATGSVRRVGEGGGARSLPDQEVYDLLQDRTGIVWFGTWDGLASLYALGGVTGRFYSGSDLEGSGVLSFADADRGGLWVGTRAGGVQLLERRGSAPGGPATRPTPLAALSGAWIPGLARGGADTLWIAAHTEGPWLLEGGAARRIPILDAEGNLRNEITFSVMVDHAGDVWAGTYTLGLVRFDRPTGSFRPYRGADPAAWDLGSDYVWPITEDAQGRLWVGAYNGGVSVIPPDRSSATLHAAGRGGLSDDRVLTLFVDSDDRVWVGTEGGGLNRLDPAAGTWTTWTVEDGLPHDNVEGIEEDLDGRFWITTFDGLARLDPTTGEILTFREPAGLAGSRFFANAAHRGSDGLLYFGGEAGLTVLDPAAIATSGAVPQASLTAFRIRGRDVPLARALRTELLDLAPNENFFTFEFAAMDFADVSQNRYRYRLVGLDPDWVEAGPERVANYTSVPPGRYTFHVAARNSDGIWNEDALAIPVRVQAPFYRTLWFQSLVVVMVLALVVGSYTYRLRQLEARQRLRLEIAGKLHDDIGANLSTIALKAEMVRGAGGLDERRSAQLADVGRLARDTAGKVRETVWVVNTKYDTVAGLVGKLYDTADTLLAGMLSYQLEGPEKVPERRISMQTRQNVHLLFKETLNNVVKHAGASRVDVTLTLAPGDVLSLRVKDDGVGFDPAAVRDGNGQRLMRQRSADLGGTLRVTSAPGAGTTVELTARLR